MIKEPHSGDKEGSDRNQVSGLKGSHLTPDSSSKTSEKHIFGHRSIADLSEVVSMIHVMKFVAKLYKVRKS